MGQAYFYVFSRDVKMRLSLFWGACAPPQAHDRRSSPCLWLIFRARKLFLELLDDYLRSGKVFKEWDVRESGRLSDSLSILYRTV